MATVSNGDRVVTRSHKVQVKDTAGSYTWMDGGINSDRYETDDRRRMIDLVAPGGGIRTTVYDNEWGNAAGTSFAAPMRKYRSSRKRPLFMS